jgi:hypothetical protein
MPVRFEKEFQPTKNTSDPGLSAGKTFVIALSLVDRSEGKE